MVRCVWWFWIAEFQVNGLGRRRLTEVDKFHKDDITANVLLIEASSNATGYETNHTLIKAVLDADNKPTTVFRVSLQPRTEIMVSGPTGSPLHLKVPMPSCARCAEGTLIAASFMSVPGFLLT